MRKKLSVDDCGNLQQNTPTNCASGIVRSLFVVWRFRKPIVQDCVSF
jgi:hypothetical protein